MTAHPTVSKSPQVPEPLAMKKVILLLAGIAAAAGCFLISRSPRKPRSVDDLAHDLQAAWADHHTVV
jgi:hypothetical protein